eukprot:2319195-Prymnesium_polylepis.1
MGAHTGDGVLQRDACRALANICTGDDDDERCQAAACAIEAVAAAIGAHTDDGELQRYACEALANICAGDNADERRQAAACAIEA